ncbi:response regulator [Marinomonas posidonica]|uniref:Two component transcriptional regulator, LuxR family n=1 Tax=Marinomonas posidonica (strain CECT 7376 / NCIMB 14433 / IVIA-Po-181) TaxID=491952 RepID=F6CTJ1_MARPP|nr:response regulator [Marinomonas posidonica]AEF54040.1 two component transcriptional regulator, LuxR family [Marinomonas posidonica IVIA-Po-181]
MLKVLIVDDHDMVSQGISLVLQDVKGVEVVGVAHSGEEAIAQSRATTPDIVLMDVHMPGIGGLGATKEIKRILPKTKVIALSALDDNLYPVKLIEAGASGYVTKGTNASELLDAINMVSKGEHYISKDIAQKMALSKFSIDDQGSPLGELSDRELQVAQMIVDCKKSSEIAEHLNVSPKTVSTYRTRIFAKLNIDSDVELIHLAVRYNVLGMG